jgi:hypothetical protein
VKDEQPLGEQITQGYFPDWDSNDDSDEDDIYHRHGSVAAKLQYLHAFFVINAWPPSDLAHFSCLLCFVKTPKLFSICLHEVDMVDMSPS